MRKEIIIPVSGSVQSITGQVFINKDGQISPIKVNQLILADSLIVIDSAATFSLIMPNGQSFAFNQDYLAPYQAQAADNSPVKVSEIVNDEAQYNSIEMTIEQEVLEMQQAIAQGDFSNLPSPSAGNLQNQGVEPFAEVLPENNTTIASVQLQQTEISVNSPPFLVDEDAVKVTTSVPPHGSIDSLFVSEQEGIWGSINDPQAQIWLSIAEQVYQADNRGDGTWQLSNSAIDTLPADTYMIKVKFVDLEGHTSIEQQSVVIHPAHLTASFQSAEAPLTEHVPLIQEADDSGFYVRQVSSAEPFQTLIMTSTEEENRIDAVISSENVNALISHTAPTIETTAFEEVNHTNTANDLYSGYMVNETALIADILKDEWFHQYDS